MTVPLGVKELKKNSIKNNDYIEEVFIPETVTKIEGLFVSDCPNLKIITFSEHFIGEIATSSFVNIAYSKLVSIPFSFHTSVNFFLSCRA